MKMTRRIAELIVVGSLGACGGEVQSASATDGGGGTESGGSPNGGTGGTTASGGTSGGTSAGGGAPGGVDGGPPCTPDPSLGSKLSGNLITYDVFLKVQQQYAGKAQIKALGANCPSVSTAWDGTASGGPDGGPPLFVLESVMQSSALITHIYPLSNDPVYPTLLRVNSTSDLQAIDGFGMVQAQGVDAAYAATGTTQDSDKGTVMVQLLEYGNQPLAGGMVDAGTNAAAAFHGPNGWQLGGVTDSTGVALLLNTTAMPYPGQGLSVNVALGGQKHSFQCPSEKGAATICWIALTP